MRPRHEGCERLRDSCDESAIPYANGCESGSSIAAPSTSRGRMRPREDVTMTGSRDHAGKRPFAMFVGGAMLALSACAGSVSSPAGSTPGPVSSTGTSTPAQATPPVARKTAAPALVMRDGEPWILYAWFQPDKRTKDIFLVRPDGTGNHVILDDLPGVHSSPTWSPDGRQFVFVVADDRAPLGSLWTAKADGSAAAALTDGEGACPDGVAHPNWSPDGSTIAFICYPDPKGKQGSVAVFDLATKSVTRLVTVDWPEHLDGAPSWSPDGKSLAFSILHWDPTDRFVDGSLIAVTQVEGGAERRLTAFDTNMSDPDWSPDGTQIATYSYDMGNMHTTPNASNLYLIKPDGTGLRQLTHSSTDGNRRIVAPRWSPDGTRIVCAIGISRGKNFTTDDLQLAFVDPAGGEPVVISPIVHGSQPALRPTP